MPEQQRPTIMVVDDEPMVVEALRTFFALETDYTVLDFTSPSRALDTLPDEQVGVVVADFMMPEMNGIDFLKEVRRLRPHAARILLTGYADVENAIRAINEAGLYYYLEKPWDNDLLKLVVRNGLERSTLVNELDARISALEHANAELLEVRRRLIQLFL